MPNAADHGFSIQGQLPSAPPATATTLKQLCRAFVTRSKTLGLKGAKRDTAMLEFMIGATNALKITGHPDADHLERVCVMIFSIRGFRECERIAQEA